MVNLSLYRHYEVLKRSTRSVRFSFVLLAAWAGTLILILRLDKLADSSLISINWNAFACISIVTLFSSICSIIMGFAGMDTEAKGADKIINDYLISDGYDESRRKEFVAQLNEVSKKIESTLVVTQALNAAAGVAIAISYLFFGLPYLKVTPDFLSSGYLWCPVGGFVLMFISALIFRFYNTGDRNNSKA